MQLIQISAWNDSGGGFLHRLFDGHPELNVWPFELLLGNDAHPRDAFSPDWFRGRFRWPAFDDLSPSQGGSLFDQISDLELKSVLAAPETAKHGKFPIAVGLGEWRERVALGWAKTEDVSQRRFIELYIRSFFELWLGSGADAARPVLGHCPTIVLDAIDFWVDFPQGRLVHVIRSPIAGYHDMKARHQNLDPRAYGEKWSMINGLAAVLAVKYPERLRLVTLDALTLDRDRTMRGLCEWLGLEMHETLLEPTWSGRKLDPRAMGPFGGVPAVSADRDKALESAVDIDDSRILLALTAGTRAELRDGPLGPLVVIEELPERG